MTALWLGGTSKRLDRGRDRDVGREGPGISDLSIWGIITEPIAEVFGDR